MPKQTESLLAAIALEKRKQERKQQLAEERVQNVAKLQLEAKEQSLRVAIVADSVQTFENLLRKVHEHKKVVRNEIEWKKFLECENLPNTNVPSEVRNFFFQWRTSLSEYLEKQINWWLECDDRSLLIQDPAFGDERRVKIKKQRVPTGRFYDQKVRAMVKVYNSLVDSLRRKKMDSKSFNDLITIRDELRAMIFKFLDALTLEIAMHVDREMTSMNPLMLQYVYTSPDFIKHIWSFKETALPETYHKLKQINMEKLSLKLTISKKFDLKESVVRGMWFKHDFFSDFCSSFNPVSEMKFETLEESNNVERLVRREITLHRLEEMRKTRQAYETRMEVLAAAEEMLKVTKTKEKKTLTPSKVRIKEEEEPPIVDDSTFVDIEDDYVAYENEQLEVEHENWLPENLGLDDGDISLREFKVINGIIKLESFRRPSQTVEIDPKIFIRINEIPNLLNHEKFEEALNMPNMVEPKDPRKSRFSKFEEKFAGAQSKAYGDLVKVELKLSDKIFWWEAPVVCRWETWEESEEFAALDPEVQDFNVNYEEHVKRESEKLFSVKSPRHYEKLITLQDFDLTKPDEHVKLSEILKNYVVPLMPLEFEHFTEKLKIFEQKQHEWKEILRLKQEMREFDCQVSAKNLKDFFEETRMKFDIQSVDVGTYHKIFDAKSFAPRSLFPVQHQNLLQILENHELLENVEEDRRKFKSQVKPVDEDIDLGIDRPVQDEPKALSELMKSIAEVKDSLEPFFRQIDAEESLSRQTTISGDVSKPRHSKKSILTRKSVNSRISNRVQSDRKSVANRKSFAAFGIKTAGDSNSSADRKSIAAKKSVIAFNEDADSVHSDHAASVETPYRKKKLDLIQHHKGKWTSKHIHKTSYDAETKTVTFYTGRLGTFALVTKKYCNLPFKSWEMFPVIESKTQRYVTMNIGTQNFKIEFKITGDGYTFVASSLKGFLLYELKNPVKPFELKKLLASLNLNVFPEVDACCYVKQHCEKHKAMEFHTYKAMANYCLSHHFKSTDWNSRAQRRVAIFESRLTHKNTFRCLMVTPMRVASVDVFENRNEAGKVVQTYEFNPSEQEFHPDLLTFLNMEVDKKEHRINLNLFTTLWFVQALLTNIQPFSFTR